MKRLRLPIGVENFEEIRKEELYYVDKTGLIKELFENFSKATLFTRPRRFGKSLNMSMLRCFFEIGTDKGIFDGLAISSEEKLCAKHMGKYPVISVSFKDVEGEDFASAKEQLWMVIWYEACRFTCLETSEKLSDAEKKAYDGLLCKTGNVVEGLRLLSMLLCKHYGSKTVLLIDEYDVPLDKAYKKGYYDEMTGLLRQMIHAVLKTNDTLQLAVLTGCLRISRESIFTGLNNLNVNTIIDPQFDEWFGFTDAEVRSMFDYYGLNDHYARTKEWYDGYRFGQENLYCPWDVINWGYHLLSDSQATPGNFWANTSSNDLIIRLTKEADADAKSDIEALIAGKTVYKSLMLDLTYPEIDEEPEYLWSVLFTTGYLTQRGMNEDGEYELAIPNREICSIFKEKIDKWFSDRIKNDTDGLKVFAEAIMNGDTAGIQAYLNDCMEDSISFQDGGMLKLRENFYHGMLLGMLKTNKCWRVRSNREAGEGRSDIIIEPVQKRKNDYAVIIELKYAKEEKQLEIKAVEALEQIKKRHYDDYFGVNRPSDIKHYGIAFFKKKCRVMQGK